MNRYKCILQTSTFRKVKIQAEPFRMGMLERLEITIAHFLKTQSVIWGELDINKDIILFSSR
jgi:hypothetical protein